MFEKATRNHLRFPFRGLCTVEDLWHLTEEELDEMYGKLRGELNQRVEESLLEKADEATESLALKIDIVKHIFKVKQDEKNARAAAVKKAAEKRRLLAILANKQDEELRGKSSEEIQKMIDELS